MPSPFPGMDPYLEDPAFWSGFHTRYVVALSASLTRVLPKGYYAEVEQHVWLQGDDPDEREPFAVPYGYVAATHGTSGAGHGAGVATATVPSAEVTLPKTVKHKGAKFIKVVDKPGNRVVTVVELLSPSNKAAGDDREGYLQKRNEYLLTGTNLVEIDLLREGERLPFGRPKPPPADYYALVSRADRFPKAAVWAFGVRDPLPILPVPLKPADGEVPLDLRAGLDRTYDDAGYRDRIDYSKPPADVLRKPDAEWAAEWLKTHTAT
ncbi:Uncharacterized protein OS=Rivularia sp. PCC 7116 GN=Riv7116_3947 PE=4 SV=1: DUF4058 [Gemmataceae bacterium]|nr:Uncharacterized protein OS=Rivularia sp. PCC 7116 GN=Riv7116_3947 PE=4 SV=1: DUF4058 [Gemmataceae bacterium]VTT96965.1 Uncharacterized protein OS=Rivularia sp. PCC 7116 GN=Riv7116_3947 PE=4 SV=1: DUF4058 [Gemmataceae bacterium]